MASAAPIITSAPGSLMLLGEHAVLRGYRALVAAINRRVTVSLFATEGDSVEIESVLGDYKAPLDALVEHPSLTFVLNAVARHRDDAPGGFKLKIESEFSADIGFGSSAAVTVATHAALARWILGEEPTKEAVFDASVRTVRDTQGRGSGSDLAASVFGGVVGYSMEPRFEAVEVAAPLTAVYCGYKTPTPEVIETVERARRLDEARFEAIYAEMDESVGVAVERLRARDFPGFGEVLSRNHDLMKALGVSTPELEEIVFALRAEPDVFGAKISGSGLGDCAIGVGQASLEGLAYPVYHLEISPVGVQYEA